MEYIAFLFNQSDSGMKDTPSEEEDVEIIFEQVECANRLGFWCHVVAQAHLSTQTQQQNDQPVVPPERKSWTAADFPQLALKLFSAQLKSMLVRP